MKLTLKQAQERIKILEVSNKDLYQEIRLKEAKIENLQAQLKVTWTTLESIKHLAKQVVG